MKFLVATACIAVIAFVGYFFWQEAEKRRVAIAVAERLELTAARERCIDLILSWIEYTRVGKLPASYDRHQLREATKACNADTGINADLTPRGIYR